MSIQCPSCNHTEVTSTPISFEETLQSIGNAITARYHLVEVEPDRFMVIDLENIHFGRPGEFDRPIIEYQPKKEPLPFQEALDTILSLRAETDDVELDALWKVLRWALPQVTFTQAESLLTKEA